MKTYIKILIALGAVFALMLGGVVFTYFAIRHDVSPDSLGRSLVDATDQGLFFPCTREDGAWKCRVGRPSDVIGTYRLEVDGHCWTARRQGRRITDFPSIDDDLPRRARGCVGFWDQL